MNKNLIVTILLIIVSFTAKSQTWTQLTSGTFQQLLSINFTDDNTGYTVGTGGAILKTIDGGLNWTPQNSGTSEAFYATWFTNALTGWAVGDNNTIQRTTDGGNTWTAVAPPVYAYYRCVWFLNANTGFITGGLSSTDATILKTTDGGNTWTNISPNTGQVIYGIFFTSQLVGYASDFDGRMLKTLDGGTTWTAQFVSSNNLHGIYFTDANTGYVSGGNIGTDSGVILKTTNAGATWSAYDVPQGFLTDIKFFGANKGVAVGGSVSNNIGLIIKTEDAGNTWTTETTNPGQTSRQYRVFLPSAQTGFSCGLNGTIFKSSVSGPCEPHLSTGLTGYFPFNGNTNDASVTGLDGIGYDLNQATGHDGVANSAYLFNGSSSWIDGGTDNRSVTSAVSVIAWVRTTEQNLGQWVVGKYRYEEDKGYALSIGNGLNQNIGQVIFGGRDGTSGSGVGHLSGYSTKRVNDGEWHCLTGIAADQQWEVYVDGTLENNAPGSTVDMSTSLGVPLTIGFQIPASPVWMNGNIDDVRIYNRRLTDCEIKDLCATPPMLILPPPEGSTVACVNDAQVVPIPPTVNTTCSEPVVVTGPVVSADPTCSGTKTYIWTYKDCAGNTGDWVYTYTIVAPTFSLPDPGASTVLCIGDAAIVPTPPAANNSCGNPIMVTGPVASADPACSGTKTYTWTYTDCTGSTANWVYTYTIDPPTFNLPEPGSSTVDCINDTQVVPIPPAVNNSCGNPLEVTGPVVGANPPCTGIKTYTWTYTDCTGNTADWVYTYRVNPPTFSLPVPGGLTVDCITAAQVVPAAPAVNNSCGDPMTVAGPVVGADPTCSGTKTYTWTYTDCTGSSADWVFTYTINPSTFSLPASGASTVSCIAAAQVMPTPPAVNNSCGDPMMVAGPVVGADPTCSGTKTYTWTYTDCGGNTADWVYTYTVTPSNFTLPASGASTVTCIAAAQVIPAPPVVNNSCGDPMMVTGPVVGATPSCSGTKTYTWTYRDCTGNTADWVYTYTITPPTFSLPAPGGSTVSCSDAQTVPTPPAVSNSCGNPLVVTGPVVSANPTCTGVKTYTWTYTDCTGNTADWVYTYTLLPEPACDEKVIGCIKYELLTITENAAHNRTYRIRVTNNCSSKLSYFAVQLPNGVQAVAPLTNTNYTSDLGRQYLVRNPNASPFYSIRFKTTTDSIANGQSDIFEYTLPPQADPMFIHVMVRLEPQVFYEAHLNTFGCGISHTSNRNASEESGFAKPDLSAVVIFPNPNAGTFNVALSQPAVEGMSFRIVSLTGQLQLSTAIAIGSDAQLVQAGDLPSGLYFLQVVSEGKIIAVEKFVKQ